MSLFLSHWDASRPVHISEDCVSDLKNYNIIGIRFLYNCYQKQQIGAILNHEDGMNFELQVSAFLQAINSAISPDNPVLVICTEETIRNWNYHLVNHGGFNVAVLSLTNADNIVESGNHCVILSIVENTAALKKIKIKDFHCVIVDHFDKLISKSIVKQIKGRFNIGLTHRNFRKHPDQKLLWTMLNWANPGVLGKLTDFCEEDNEHLINLRDAYSNWWQRLTWKYCDSFIPPTDNEIKEYQMKLRQWSQKHKTKGDPYCPKTEAKSENKKLKLASPDLGSNKSTKSKREQTHQPKELRTEVENDTNIKEEKMDIEDGLKTNISDTLSDSNDDKLNTSQNSDDTIIYDFKDSPAESSDENDILSSIISGKNTQRHMSSKSKKSECSLLWNNANDSDDDVVSSIIGSNTSNSTKATEKNEILSLLYGEDDDDDV